MRNHRNGYFLLEIMMAFCMVLLLAKALLGLASHVVSMRIGIQRRLAKAPLPTTAMHINFTQHGKSPKGQVPFSATVAIPHSAQGDV